MTLGLGIFLSSLFLGIIYLFVSTKDRWNWKKILFIWPLYFVLVVGVIGGAGFYIYNYYESKTKIYDTYLNISLNASENDLIFIKGDGYDVKKYDSGKNNIYIAYQENKKNEYTHNIRLKEGKVWRISCSSNRSYDCPPINKISLNYTTSEVEERLGKPDYESSNDDSTERLWVYERLNVYMNLKQGKIVSIGIFDPSLGLPKYADTKYVFIDLNQYGDKKLTIKEIPLIVDEEGHEKVDKNLLNEIKAASSEGDEVVWGEFVASREKKIKEQDSWTDKYTKKSEGQAKDEKVDGGNRFLQLRQDISKNWLALKKGMTMFQVEKLLGKPLRTEGSAYVYWYYTKNQGKGGAHVYFYSENVSGWKMP